MDETTTAGPAPDGPAPEGSAVAAGSRGWLGLLADDCSPGDIQRLRAALLAGADDATRRRVEDEAQLAETIRARLADRGRDARELRVRDDLVRRLASLRDSAGLLQEVVAQSRFLLGVDVAFILLPTADGGLRIDIVDGSLGDALLGVVLRDGEGLGGEVMRSGRPLWSESYLDDGRLRRVRSVDSVVVSEHIGGVLGVPLRFGRSTLGVLLAADRRPRRFSDHEVELLAGLAAHAAVALRNAQLFEENQRAVADLRQSNEALKRTDTLRRQAGELREQLTAEVLRGGGIPEVGRAVARAVGLPVQVFGADGTRLDAGPGADDIDVVAVIGSAPERWLSGQEPASRTAIGPDHLALVPIRMRDGCAGCLVAVSDARIGDETVRLLEIGAMTAALVVATERSVAEAELRTRGAFVTALLAGDGDDAELRRRAVAADIDIDAIGVVVVLDNAGQDERAVAAAATRIAAELRGWVAQHAGRFVVLARQHDVASVRARIAALWDGDLPAAGGIAPAAGGVAAVRTGHEAARQTAAVLLALKLPGAVATAAEVGPYRSLFSHAGRDDIAAFVEAALGPVLAYDRARGRDLATTLEAFLGQSQHHARTCEQLRIHPNTLYQRLERIGELLGTGWREPGRTLQLQLALHLRGLAQTLAPDTGRRWTTP
ncbi:GAF domain-containing protein [Streptomyces sp. NPDC005820]|uniref:helix-turn-helix domain-containing protein n=1 Tax=Streptomyces sp. NPDC005820 TaxID=3157069 RepID=UPI0033CE6700